ncbi:MAG TPA: MFS transporter [Solirubrobacteraceae bacterium]|jgi:EmrB/QacA subfamily drug resistance transporter|nr:MFS transporter [Solirubrobacteraceae bacterium]
MSALGMDAAAKRMVLVACILGTTVVTVDSTAINVALPAIAEDLGGGLAGQQWVANAYLLTLSSFLLVGGSLGDVIGERRVFVAGIAGFGVTSLLCALAPTIEALVAARALQGMSGALLTPAALAVIVRTFAETERAQAVGAWTAWAGIGTVLGPVVGGQLVDSASWRWIFLVNLPLVLGTLFIVSRAVPADAARRPGTRLDLAGAGLCALGLAGITFGLIEQPMRGWSDPAVAFALVAGVALFALFVLYERRASHPMLPLGLFGRRNFAAGNIETFAMYGGLSVTFFLLVLFLQGVAGFSALAAGSASIPVTLVMFVLAARFGRLADRYGPRLFMGTGPLVCAVGLALMLRLDADVDYWTDLFPALLVFALGLAIVVAPLTATVLSDADEHNAGIASAVNNAIARVAGLVAIAAIGATVASQYDTRFAEALGGAREQPAVRAAVDRMDARPFAVEDPEGLDPSATAAVVRAQEEASVDSFHFGIGIAVVLVGLGGVLGFAGIRNPRRQVAAEGCAGGQFVGVPEEASRQSPCDWHRELPAVTLPAREAAT